MDLCVAHRYGGTFQNASVKLPSHTQQVFPAHRNGFLGFFPALETAEQGGSLSIGGQVGGAPGCSQLTGRLLCPHSPSRRYRASSCQAPDGHRGHQGQGYRALRHGRSQGRRGLAPEETGGLSPLGGLSSAGAGATAPVSSPSPQIIGFGSALLEEVDPNSCELCGRLHHTHQDRQIGCLLRLEPNLQAQVQPLGSLSALGGASP